MRTRTTVSALADGTAIHRPSNLTEMQLLTQCGCMRTRLHWYSCYLKPHATRRASGQNAFVFCRARSKRRLVLTTSALLLHNIQHELDMSSA